MKYLLFLLASVIALCACYSMSTAPIEIVPIPGFNEVTYGGASPTRLQVDNYLIKHYKDNQETERYLDSFVQKNIDSSAFTGSYNYKMLFYKESSETNLKNYGGSDHRVVSTESHLNDFVFVYTWTNTSYKKDKYKDGYPIDTAKHTGIIELLDIDSSHRH